MLLTDREDIKPLLCRDRLREFKWTIPNVETKTTVTDQWEKDKKFSKFGKLFKANRTVQDTEIKIKIKFLIQLKRRITEKPCQAHFAKDRDEIVTTDASQTGIAISLWQKQNNNTIRPIAFASRYLKGAEQNYLIEELEQLAVVWGLEKFRFYLYGKNVNLHTDHQTLETLIKRNRVRWQYSARLTKWLDWSAHFELSKKHTARKN